VIVDRAAAVLAERGVPSPRVDAEWIVAHTLGVTRSSLVTACYEADEAAVWPLVERRGRREPLAYVLGEWGFRRLTLRCDARALVPRPETEIVVECCLRLLGGREGARVLDVGTGTGAIALALADEAGAAVVAVDASEGALELARENATRAGLAVELVRCHLRDALPGGPFDLVVANLPYVLADEWPSLEPEVREWEPRDALVDEGQTEALAERARDLLAATGHIVLEVHERRAQEIAQRLERLGYTEPRITSDLAGRERVVEATWP
jgi:release factor glutamine methyltransferase